MGNLTIHNLGDGVIGRLKDTTVSLSSQPHYRR